MEERKGIMEERKGIMEKYYIDYLQRLRERQRRYDEEDKKEKWLNAIVAVIVGAILLGAWVLG